MTTLWNCFGTLTCTAQIYHHNVSIKSANLRRSKPRSCLGNIHRTRQSGVKRTPSLFRKYMYKCNKQPEGDRQAFQGMASWHFFVDDVSSKYLQSE